MNPETPPGALSRPLLLPKLWPWLIAVAGLSAAYYSLYLDTGFNFADDGNYAQFAYELARGRPVSDVALNYGLVWFQIGAALFRWFGVDYLLIKGVFFAAITATNVLAFCALAILTKRLALAAILTAVTAAAPAFPATAFYGLCVAMNVAAQAWLAERQSRATWMDAALTGVALSVSFQLRPDFGYLFVFPLAIVIAGTSARGKMTLAAVTGFVAAGLPILLAAAAGGFVDVLIDQSLAYPAMMIDYLSAGLANVGNGGTVSGGLARPAVSSLIAGDWEKLAFAWLVYLPVLGIVSVIALQGRATWADLRIGQLHRLARLAVILSAAAGFPYYFLFRPDFAHVANFMPGYVIICGAVVAAALERRRAPGHMIAAAVVTANAALYTWAGTVSPETGSIGIAAGRTDRFTAGNGVDVKVNAGELALLTQLRDVIAANSKAGDAIVCVPYCPGIAFMSERHMLLDRFFVDDSILTREPDWLTNAIAKTRAERPPVVIVMNWAINGTEFSRFKNWAAPYMSMLDETARDRIVQPDLTVFFLRGAD
ncbi:MAG: hypothetical protein KDE14_13475 [Rhodobacteraceae bacterium]|nr:hypothetical protein [Paracoccaceae bacterium]